MRLTEYGARVSRSCCGIERTPGSTHITGTATSPYGVYPIDVTR